MFFDQYIEYYARPINFFKVLPWLKNVIYIRTLFAEFGVCSDKTVTECHALIKAFMSS
jgi:hypothetical protein